MSTLDLNDYTAGEDNTAPPSGEHLADCKRVKNIGLIAVILVVIGIVIPFVADIAAFFLAKKAMKLSRNRLVPIEFERPAYWAYRLSIIGIFWWVLIVVRVLS